MSSKVKDVISRGRSSRAATAAVRIQTFTHPTDPWFDMHVSNYFPLQPLEQALEGVHHPRHPCPTQLQNSRSTTSMTLLRQVPVAPLCPVRQTTAHLSCSNAYGLEAEYSPDMLLSVGVWEFGFNPRRVALQPCLWARSRLGNPHHWFLPHPILTRKTYKKRYHLPAPPQVMMTYTAFCAPPVGLLCGMSNEGIPDLRFLLLSVHALWLGSR
jgi:hypothetical protein